MLLKAIEEKRFHPMGSDREVESDFQLIAGTNRDLRQAVAAGRFRDDLFARINLWTYELPGLAQRSEDIEPNMAHLLALYAHENQRVVRFTAEAHGAYLQFAQSAEALWRGNFRDLSASITRLATLADSGRIGLDLVQAEIQRLRWLWQSDGERHEAGRVSAPASSFKPAPVDTSDRDHWGRLLGPEQVVALDLFDRLQLQAVLQICRQAQSLSDAGRQLFQASRSQRRVVNDADRLRKYLARFGLDWQSVRASVVA